MNSEKVSLREEIGILGRALKISLKAKNALSLIVSILGFAMAFLPTFIATTIRRFSDGVQALYGMGTAAVSRVLGVFILPSALLLSGLSAGLLLLVFIVGARKAAIRRGRYVQKNKTSR